jgi:hypothetical protein
MIKVDPPDTETQVYLANVHNGTKYRVKSLLQPLAAARQFVASSPYPMPGDAKRAQKQAAIVKKLAGLAQGLLDGNSKAELDVVFLAERARELVEETPL